jgi:hypothetical protein
MASFCRVPPRGRRLEHLGSFGAFSPRAFAAVGFVRRIFAGHAAATVGSFVVFLPNHGGFVRGVFVIHGGFVRRVFPK